ncbi:MAG: BON domain-containing protein [Pseudomonadales bacterium]|nr:BON domain-containing protein [Pseudomonadales bacterium]
MKFFLPLIAICFLLEGCMFWGPEDRGKRTLGTRIDDRRTESLATKNIRKAHPELENAHFNVTSFNGVVLITGQVPSEEAKEIAGETAGSLRNVKTVHNELKIAGPTSMVARTNDNWLTTKVKSVMAFSDQADAGRIKVVTEDGVVYLMGLVTRGEAEAAVKLTRDIYGVQKIVKVFEYIN